ncbi:MAG: YqaA family protein [Bryobacteraceae bacterium]
MRHLLEAFRDLGPTGVFILSTLDSAGFPVISGVDALLVWVAISNPQAAYVAAGMAVLGSLIGSLVLFFIARKGGDAYLERHTVSRRGARLKRWFLEYGLLTILVPALVPIPMPLKVFILSAGALGVSPLVFTLVLLAARIPRYFGLAWLGLQLGDQTLPYLTHHIWQLTAIAAGLFLGLYLLIKLLDRRRKLRQLVTDSE